MAVIVRNIRKASETAPEPAYAALHRVADRNVTRLARAFLEAFGRLREQISEEDAERAVAGHWDAVLAPMDRITFRKAINPAELEPLAGTILDIAVDAGKASVTWQSLSGAQQAQMLASFNVVNPFAVQWAQSYAARLVQGIVEENKQAIRSIISRAMAEGGAPRDTAKLIRHTIGLNQRQVSAIGNFRAGLVADGVDPDRIERMVARKAQRALKDRALTISRTETMRSANSGQQLLWGEMSRRGYLDPGMRKIFIVTHDDRLCSRCVALDGQTVEVIGGRFAEQSGATAEMPPIHPRCRCTAGLVEGVAAPGVTGDRQEPFPDALGVERGRGRSRKPLPDYRENGRTDYSAIADWPEDVRLRITATLEDLQQRFGVSVHSVVVGDANGPMGRALMTGGRRIQLHPRLATDAQGFIDEVAWARSGLNERNPARIVDRFLASHRIEDAVAHEYGHLLDNELQRLSPGKWKALHKEWGGITGVSQNNLGFNTAFTMDSVDAPQWLWPARSNGEVASQVSMYAVTGGTGEMFAEVLVHLMNGRRLSYVDDLIKLLERLP